MKPKIIDVPENIRKSIDQKVKESNIRGNQILRGYTQIRGLEKEIENLFIEREKLTNEITEGIKAYMDTINETSKDKNIIYNPDNGKIEIYDQKKGP